MSINGWQAVAALLIGAGLAALGALTKTDSLVTLAGTMLGGVLGILQPWRDPGSRGRAADRRPTGAGGVPVPPGPDERRAR